MGYQLTCRICGKTRKADSRKFPLKLYGEVEKKVRGKVLKTRGIIGYGCSICQRKYRREKFIERHTVTPKPGQTISDAIKEKTEQLKMAPQPRIRSPKETPEPRGWRRLFKKRGRPDHGAR